MSEKGTPTHLYCTSARSSCPERKLDNTNVFKDIATIIVDKCIDPKTGRSPTIGMVEAALREIGASVNTQKTAKAQALFFIKELQKKSSLSLERAKVLSVHWPSNLTC